MLINKDTKIFCSFSSNPGNNGCEFFNTKFQENNINAIGFDGNPNTPELTNNLCKVLDLSIPKQFNKPFDWVMTLEVGEHLPQQFEDIFIQNIHNNNKYI